jgi:hypothetical protein
MLSIRGAAAVALPAAALAVFMAASPAMAGNGVTAVTHSSHHADTTNVSGTCTVSSGNGPVWAYDNLEEQFTVTPYGTGEYRVVLDVRGSFQGFADPKTGDCLASSGPVHGTITYYVLSSTGPDPSALLPNQAPDTGLGAAIQQLFPGFTGYDWAPADAGDYTFSYQNGNYVQDTTSITGDVQGR